MNALKNMEAIFVVALVLVGVTTYANAAAPAFHAAPAARVSVIDPSIPTVHVVGKRLTAAQKAAL